MVYSTRIHPAPRHLVPQVAQSERATPAAPRHPKRPAGPLAMMRASVSRWRRRDRDDSLVIVFNRSGPIPLVIDIGC